MSNFNDELEKAIIKRKAIINGYRLLKTINPQNRQIIEDYINTDSYHKAVISDAIKSGEIEK